MAVVGTPSSANAVTNLMALSNDWLVPIWCVMKETKTVAVGSARVRPTPTTPTTVSSAAYVA